MAMRVKFFHLKKNYAKFGFAILGLGLSQTSCAELSANLNTQSKFGDNYAYFAALKVLNNGDEPEAIRLFALGAKNAEGIIKRKCVEELTRIGTISERLNACAALASGWNDDAAAVRAVQEFFAAREYRGIINITDSRAIKENELLRYRISALAELQDSRLAIETSAWFNDFPFSESQRVFFRAYGFPKDLGKTERELFFIREAVFIKNYETAAKRLFEFLEKQGGHAAALAEFSPALLSDAGKILLYGSSEYAKNALMLDNAASTLKQKNANAFYLYFYAGRLYDRSGSKNEGTALDRFQKAMNEALALGDNALYDNALWYYLSSALKISAKDALDALALFGATFRDKSYYDDFFDALALTLLHNKQWSDFYAAADSAVQLGSGESRSKYAYLAGRLLQLRLVKNEQPSEDWFRKACEPGGNIYYALLASRALGISPSELERILFSRGKETNAGGAQAQSDADRLLLGYAEHGFPEMIYREWVTLRDGVSNQTVITLADFLQNCAEQKLKTQGLRMISRTIMNANNFENPAMAERALKLVYPQFFKDEITAFSAEFDIPPSYIFALTRSESFFEPNVLSHAGARGLTQLMDATAADIARKLKVAEYDILEAKTNLRFGTFYFAEMLSRLDGNVLAAYFAYNAGITRVRAWLSAAKGVPADIFLETLPFAETREYGKNVLTAICFYAWLYEGESVRSSLDAVFGGTFENAR
jgi:soluble lytic murein transglycosylase